MVAEDKHTLSSEFFQSSFVYEPPQTSSLFNIMDEAQ